MTSSAEARAFADSRAIAAGHSASLYAWAALGVAWPDAGGTRPHRHERPECQPNPPDSARAVAHRLERDRVRGDAGQRRHLHHDLQHGELRPDGGAHRRLHRRRAFADALRLRIPDASLVGAQNHSRPWHRRRLQHAVRARSAIVQLLRHRSQSSRQPVVGAGVESDGISDRPDGGQDRHRADAGRSSQSGHAAKRPRHSSRRSTTWS